LIQNITDNAASEGSADNIQAIYLNGTCDQYESTLGAYSFKVNFESDMTNYVRVPLMTFATTYYNTGNCELVLSPSNSDAIIFGGMFFVEFYGQFTNSYTSTSSSLQSASLYVSEN